MRIAIVNPDKCKPKECGQECKKNCLVVRMGKLCIVVSKKDKIATISEELCNGCNICTKKCPFNAISIINLPAQIPKELVHRYGENSFQLYRLPIPRMGQVLGLLGSNGTGKSSVLKMLGAKLTPNLGDWKNGGSWENILSYYKGSELQNYFTKILENKLKVVIKPQYIDIVGKMVKGGVKDNLDKKDERGNLTEVLEYLELEHLYIKKIEMYRCYLVVNCKGFALLLSVYRKLMFTCLMSLPLIWILSRELIWQDALGPFLLFLLLLMHVLLLHVLRKRALRKRALRKRDLRKNFLHRLCHLHHSKAYKCRLFSLLHKSHIYT